MSLILPPEDGFNIPVFFDDDESYLSGYLVIGQVQSRITGSGHRSVVLTERTKMILDALQVPYNLGYPEGRDSNSVLRT